MHIAYFLFSLIFACVDGQVDLCGGVRLPHRAFCCNEKLYYTILGRSDHKDRVDECCKGTPYNSRLFACCNGKLQPRREHSHYTLCCGSRTYDPVREICCCGKVEPKQCNLACCGNRFYNRLTHICCNGIVHKKIKSVSCCRSRVYNLNYEICCGDQIHKMQDCCTYEYDHPHRSHHIRDFDDDRRRKRQLVHGKPCVSCYVKYRYTMCCGHRLFDRRTHSCCGGDIYSSGSGQGCCNGALYNSVLKICCDGGTFFKIYGTDTRCCPSKNDCASKHYHKQQLSHYHYKHAAYDTPIYDSKKYTCCAGHIAPKVATKRSCCQTIAYDVSKEVCCRGVLHTKKIRHICCGVSYYNYDRYKCGCNYQIIPIPIGYKKATTCNRIIYPISGYCCNERFYPYPNYTGCCGGEPIKRGQRCCSADPGRFINTGKLYYYDRQFCCQGRVNDRPIGQVNGISRISRQIASGTVGNLTRINIIIIPNITTTTPQPTTTTTTGRIVQVQVPIHHYRCCGEKVYNFYTQTCCCERLFSRRSGGACCNHKPYNGSKHVCCYRTGKLYLRPFFNTCCYGMRPYNSLLHRCCPYARVINRLLPC